MEKEEVIDLEVKSSVFSTDHNEHGRESNSEMMSLGQTHERTCSQNDVGGYNFLTHNIVFGSERNCGIKDLDSISQGNVGVSDASSRRKERRSVVQQNDIQIQKELEMTLEIQKEKVSKLEAQLKEKSEILRVTKLSSEKESAILSQKIEFLELQLNEVRSQLQESRNSHEILMKAMEDSSSQEQSKSESKLYNELKMLHQNEIKSLESESEISKKRLFAQIENLQEKNLELQNTHSQFLSQKEKDMEIIKEEMIKSDRERIAAEEKLRSIENEKKNYVKINEETYKQRITDLESQLEGEKETNRKELSEFHNKYEDSLSQLREFYENERTRLEKRVSEEKDKWQKRISQITEEYENRIQNDTMYFEDEIMGLKKELDSKINDANYSSSNLETNLKDKIKQLETLESKYLEIKDKFEKSLSSNDTHLATCKEEREQLIGKFEVCAHNLKEKEKELFILNNKFENSENTIKCYQEKIEELQKRLQATKLDLENENATLRLKFDSLKEESKTSKFNCERDIALKDQQLSFLQQKLDDYSKKISHLTDENLKKLAETKSELIGESEKKLKRALDENYSLQERVRECDLMYNNLQDRFNQKTLEFEEERNILKYHNDKLDREVRELEKCLEEETSSLKEALTKNKDSFFTEKSSLSNECEKYKSLFCQADQDKNDILTSYERDKALWQGKFTFLEEQKEQAKKDLADALRKFELTLQHMKRARNSEKDEQESNMNELIITIEKKYHNQIQELQQNSQKTITELEDKIRKLEKEIKTCQEKLASHQNRLNTSFMEELKLSETLERERKFKKDFEITLEEKEAKISEYKRLIENEREAFRSKLNEMDQKYRDSENKRTGLLFEYEKEKALWKYERETLISEKTELLDDVRKMERGRDSGIGKDNETRSKKSISINKVLNTSGMSLNTQGNNYTRGKSYKNEYQKRTFFTNLNDKSMNQETNENQYDGRGLSVSYLDNASLRDKFK